LLFKAGILANFVIRLTGDIGMYKLKFKGT